MREDMYSREENGEKDFWRSEAEEEEERLEVMKILFVVVALLAILSIYGDVLGIHDKIVTTYKYLWLAIFPH